MMRADVSRFLLLSKLLLFAAFSSQSQDAALLIDNFDGSNKLRDWTFSNGAEFPGANGRLSVGPGHEGRGALLTYRFTCLDHAHCGHYVAAIWNAPHPLEVNPGAVLSLWVSLSPDVRIAVRVTDQTHQNLQFYANAPTLEHPAPGEWQRINVAITGQAAGHWGGANNGRFKGRIAQLAILADSRYGQAGQEQIGFDELRVLTTVDSTLRLEQRAAVIAGREQKGDIRSRLGVNIHFLHDNRALDLARDAGFGFVRTDLLWAQLEQHGEYVFAPFDDLMHALEARSQYKQPTAAVQRVQQLS